MWLLPVVVRSKGIETISGGGKVLIYIKTKQTAIVSVIRMASLLAGEMESDDLRPPRAFAALRAALTANPTWHVPSSTHSTHSKPTSTRSIVYFTSTFFLWRGASQSEAMMHVVVVRYTCNGPDVWRCGGSETGQRRGEGGGSMTPAGLTG